MAQSARCALQFFWLGDRSTHLTAKFRYRSRDIPIEISYQSDDLAIVQTLEPAWAVTPGQACVFYDGEYCLGGGTIEKAFMNDEERIY